MFVVFSQRGFRIRRAGCDMASWTGSRWTVSAPLTLSPSATLWLSASHSIARRTGSLGRPPRLGSCGQGERISGNSHFLLGLKPTPPRAWAEGESRWGLLPLLLLLPGTTSLEMQVGTSEGARGALGAAQGPRRPFRQLWRRAGS